MNHNIAARAAEAKARWGDTDAYKEFEAKTAGQSQAELQNAGDGLMAQFSAFGELRNRPVSDPAVRAQVLALQAYITAHFYTCTDEILAGLGELYGAGGEITETIDQAGGAGTAAFASRAIAYHCRTAV